MAKKSAAESAKPTEEPTAPEPAVVPTPEERLRAFEDKHCGADATRVDGKVERGHGSRFALLSPETRAHHATLERLVAAHGAYHAAKTALSTAEMEMAAAELAANAIE